MPRKAKISREEVLEAALRLVDAQGLAALSMRKLAEEVGVEAMSLYRHFPNKAAILDGLHETVLGQMPKPPASDDWKEDVRGLAKSFRGVLGQHPEVLPLFISRPAVTENSLSYLEAALQTLRQPFPDLALRLQVFQSLFAYVLGYQMMLHSPGEPVAVAYDQLDPERFPESSRLIPVLYEHDVD